MARAGPHPAFPAPLRGSAESFVEMAVGRQVGPGLNLMKQLTRKALLLFISLTASLLLAEFIVSVVKPQDLSGSWGEQTERGLVVNKSEGVSRHQFGSRLVRYSFAAPHLRAPAPKASVRVLVLGDSFTFGYLLGDGHTYVNLLQSRLDGEFGPGVFSLLNGAVAGWGSGDYVAFVDDFGEEVAPDVILVFLSADDIGRALRSPQWAFNPADGRLTRAGAPRSRLKALLNGLPGYQWLLEHSHLVQLLRNQAELLVKKPSRLVPAQPSPGPSSEPDVEGARRGRALGEALFRRLASWCNERNVKLLVASTGWHKPVGADPAEPTGAFMSGAGPFFSGLGVPYSDPWDTLWPRLGAEPGRFMIQGDGHPNEAGAALIAEGAFPFIESQLTDYCRSTARCKAGDGARP